MLVEATGPMGPAVISPLAGYLPWSFRVQTLGLARKWLSGSLPPASDCNCVITHVLYLLVVSNYSSGKLVN